MSYVSQITCDAPNCTSVKATSNHWWVLRKDFRGFFQSLPMKGHNPIDGDRHLCSTPCMHSMLESWMEENMTSAAAIQGPCCTCKDTYEVGSGARCPVHEKDHEETMEERSARLYPDGVDHKGDAVWPYSGRR